MTRAEAARINGLLGGKEPRHGHSRVGMITPTYRAWKNMNQRCSNQALPEYARYGGRGIRVCARWRVFENFLADMGECPPGLTLDRRNNDGNYEPDNCRWATRATQRRNTCTVKLSEEIAESVRARVASGEVQAAVARDLGVTPCVVNAIVKGRAWRTV